VETVRSSATSCEICGSIRGLECHHILHRKLGGSKDPRVHDHANLVTLCRRCHTTLHEGTWQLTRLPDGIRVIDTQTGEPVMRRRYCADLDVPKLFHLLTLVDGSLTHLVEAVPFLSDDQLVDAFAAAQTFGKRGWLIQAAILYEAQLRSIHGEGSLAAIARRFDLSLRQAQKYALVWKTFFTQPVGDDNATPASATPAENVNIDAIVLDDPSWYLIAASETPDPQQWLAYAQDRKLADPRYTVAAFRRDICRSRRMAGLAHADRAGKADEDHDADDPGQRLRWDCPWITPYCTRSGRPVPVAQCTGCITGRCATVAAPAVQEEASR
jgi:hypothetical protein